MLIFTDGGDGGRGLGKENYQKSKIAFLYKNLCQKSYVNFYGRGETGDRDGGQKILKSQKFPFYIKTCIKSLMLIFAEMGWTGTENFKKSKISFLYKNLCQKSYVNFLLTGMEGRDGGQKILKSQKFPFYIKTCAKSLMLILPTGGTRNGGRGKENYKKSKFLFLYKNICQKSYVNFNGRGNGGENFKKSKIPLTNKKLYLKYHDDFHGGGDRKF
jgi:hypothetical protein